MTEHEEELLMRHVDGEVSESEAAEVGRLLAASPEARAIVRDLENVGHVVRALADEQGRAADDVAERVMARLPAQPSLEPARRAKVIALVPAFALALAAAAAVALLVRPKPGVIPATLTPSAAPIAVLSPPAPEASGVGEAPEPEEGAEIESVDFGAQNGSIFMVATGPQVTPVVWLSDDAPSGGRMQTL